MWSLFLWNIILDTKDKALTHKCALFRGGGVAGRVKPFRPLHPPHPGLFFKDKTKLRKLCAKPCIVGYNEFLANSVL